MSQAEDMSLPIYQNPAAKDWDTLCARCQNNQADITDIVADILQQVRTDGDAALRRIAQKVDGFAPTSFQLDAEAIAQACANVKPEIKHALAVAKQNIEAFHRAQLPQPVRVSTMEGVDCMQKAVPMQRVGLYIPGGKAPLFSTVLMLAIPAKLAGCNELILCTPMRKDGYISPEIIYAASLCGVDKIYAVGGAQAVAAMAFGTESIPKVDKIFGPGNRFVTTAKQMLGGKVVSIDMPAGPSEVMVIADDKANAEFVASDLLSQAEHGDDSQSILVCQSTCFAEKVNQCLKQQTQQLSRAETINRSLGNSRIIVFDDRDFREKALEFANCYAPEHLILSVQDPWSMADGVTAAGSVFVGAYSPESAGDYASGTNHTLPTNGWARSCSGVNIDSFMRKITFQEITREGLGRLASTITTMAMAEGLDAHANAVIIRMKGGQE